MTNPFEQQQQQREEPSPSLSQRLADDNLSNSDGPLIASRKHPKLTHPNRSQMPSSAMMMHTDNWSKSNGGYFASDEKKNNRFIWTLTLVLSFFGLCNLVLNVTILVVLRVSQGMEAMEVIPGQDLVKFIGNTDLDRVLLQRGVCEGFGDEPIQLVGDAAGVNIRVANRRPGSSWSDLQVLENGTSVSRAETFQIKDPRSGSAIFSTDFPNFSLPQGVKRIEVNLTQTHRIVAPKADDLRITSDEAVSMHGAEGASLDSRDIAWTARDGIFLKSRNGDIVIDAKDGVNLPNIPVAASFLPAQSGQAHDQFKVCVCMPDGKVFLVPAHSPKINCAKVSRSMQVDPCVM